MVIVFGNRVLKKYSEFCSTIMVVILYCIEAQIFFKFFMVLTLNVLIMQARLLVV